MEYEQKEYARKRRQCLKDQHRCVFCGNQDEKTLSGNVLCLRCATKQNEKQRGKYQRKKLEKQRRESDVGEVVQDTVERKLIYKTMARRNNREKWTDFWTGAELDIAEKQYRHAKSYGLQAKIVEKWVLKKTPKPKEGTNNDDN